VQNFNSKVKDPGNGCIIMSLLASLLRYSHVSEMFKDLLLHFYLCCRTTHSDCQRFRFTSDYVIACLTDVCVITPVLGLIIFVLIVVLCRLHPAGDRIRMHKNRLRINDVTTSDNGVFDCRAHNLAGSVNSSNSYLLSVPGIIRPPLYEYCFNCPSLAALRIALCPSPWYYYSATYTRTSVLNRLT